jgi:DNA-binding transcriptional MerR regulator
MITTVREIANQAGVDINTVRKYADKGLIESRRNVNGWRVFPYPDKAIKQIQGLMNGEIKLDSHESKQT